MNKTERIKAVRAMEFLARQINSENIFEQWLIYGVADGDINDNTTDEDLECYIDDNTFEEIMKTFLNCMARAKKHGGLYCDNITGYDWSDKNK